MSRSYNARRKAKRQKARSAEERSASSRRLRPRRLSALIPALAIAAILATVGILGFGSTSSSGINKREIQQKISTLLAGIPQQGTTLGSPEAPMTLWIFADLECPTVRRFVTAYLPSIIRTWVRDGTVKLVYRSLETDTFNEQTFYEQESAALAAGRQNKMWNYALTFIHEQGPKQSDYATDEFLADIASQIQGLHRRRWQHDREDPLLSKQVALELHSAYVKELQFTPSFLLSYGETGGHLGSSSPASLEEEFKTFLSEVVSDLVEEASGDVPTLRVGAS
jgi:protein-disulfide isomerase